VCKFTLDDLFTKNKKQGGSDPRQYIPCKDQGNNCDTLCKCRRSINKDNEIVGECVAQNKDNTCPNGYQKCNSNNHNSQGSSTESNNGDSTTNDNNTKSSGSSVTTYALIGGGVAAAVVIIGAAIFVIKKKRADDDDSDDEDEKYSYFSGSQANYNNNSKSNNLASVEASVRVSPKTNQYQKKEESHTENSTGNVSYKDEENVDVISYSSPKLNNEEDDFNTTSRRQENWSNRSVEF